jgi:hypothetical protein
MPVGLCGLLSPMQEYLPEEQDGTGFAVVQAPPDADAKLLLFKKSG